MIELIFHVILKNKVKVLTLLATQQLYMSSENNCCRITNSTEEDVEELRSNQEEADTRLILHANHALIDDCLQSVTIRSPSGDTVVILTIDHLFGLKEKVFIDNGRSDTRRLIPLDAVDLSVHLREALLGFHAFTGNDYVSSFIKKGKKTCWNKLQKKTKFTNCFAAIGNSNFLQDDVFKILEEYVCFIYGSRSHEINEVRYEIFTKKTKREDNIVDLSLLPPCKSVLRLHAERANMVAYIWRNTLTPQVVLPNYSECVWDIEGKIQYVLTPFPESVEDILLDTDYDEVEEYGRDEVSEGEEFE